MIPPAVRLSYAAFPHETRRLKFDECHIRCCVDAPDAIVKGYHAHRYVEALIAYSQCMEDTDDDNLDLFILKSSTKHR